MPMSLLDHSLLMLRLSLFFFNVVIPHFSALYVALLVMFFHVIPDFLSLSHERPPHRKSWTLVFYTAFAHAIIYTLGGIL
jgi:hypothetical protein